jgi:protein-S-isoprenylcysteine O-methyltransferase Ste14
VFDVLLGLSMLGWAGLGLWRAPPADRLTPVMLSLAALHGTVGSLLIARAREVEGGGPRRILLALPSLLASGVAFKLAPAPGEWLRLMSGSFAVATAWTLLSLGWLGRSFAILPARRALVTTGPYRLLRHPAYLGELVLLQIVGAASGHWPVQAVCLAAIPLTTLRIQAEERLLAADPAWEAYRRRTRWRLVPGLW